MKFRSVLLTSVAFVGISGVGFGTIDAKASTDVNEEQLVEIATDEVDAPALGGIRDYTVTLPTFFKNYQLTAHKPGMTYVTSNNSIKVSSSGSLETYFSTTAYVYVYNNGVLDHTITVVVGKG